MNKRVGRIIKIENNRVFINLDKKIDSSTIVFENDNYPIGGINTLYKIIHEDHYLVCQTVFDSTEVLKITDYKNPKFINVVECVIIGELKCNKFNAKALLTPNLLSSVLVLEKNEFKLISNAIEDSEFSLGYVLNYSSIDFSVNIVNFFKKHTGIFGVTGSGKSNTLAKISELYMKYINNKKNNKKNINNKMIIFDPSEEFIKNWEKYNQHFNKLNIMPIDLTKNSKNSYAIDCSLFSEESLSILFDINSSDEREFLADWWHKVKDIVNINSFNKRKEINSNELLKLFYINLIKYFTTFINNILDISSDTNPTKKSKIKNYVKNIKKYFGPIKSHDVYYNILNDFLNFYDSVNLKSFNNSSWSLCIGPDSKKLDMNYSNDIQDDFIDQIKNINLTSDLSEEIALKRNWMFMLISDIIIKTSQLNKSLKRSTIYERFLNIKNNLSLFSTEFTQNVNFFSYEKIIFNDIFIINTSSLDYLSENIVGIYTNIFYTINSNKERKDTTTHFVLDEAHRYLKNIPNYEEMNQVEKLFHKIAREGRKYGQFVILATQKPNDISEKIYSQLGNFVVHKLVTQDDIGIIKRNLFLPSDSFIKNIKHFTVGECVFFAYDSPIPILLKFNVPEIELYGDTIGIDN